MVHPVGPRIDDALRVQPVMADQELGLFEGKTDNSRMGQVRKPWREHLEIDDAALRLVARVLAVAESPESMMSLRERLDDRFAAVGMRRIPASESGFIYDDLAEKLLAQGRTEFDRDSFREMARGEGLLVDPAPSGNGLTIGVRSFMHPIDDLENRCGRMLDLVPYFDGRYIRNPADWQQRLYPTLRDFVLAAARTGERLRLIVDAHVSLAFAVGALLNVKSGKRIEIEQRCGGRRFLSMNDQAADQTWPAFELSEEVIGERVPEIALAVDLTHDVSDGVRAYIKSQGPGIGRILHCRPPGRAFPAVGPLRPPRLDARRVCGPAAPAPARTRYGRRATSYLHRRTKRFRLLSRAASSGHRPGRRVRMGFRRSARRRVQTWHVHRSVAPWPC